MTRRTFAAALLQGLAAVAGLFSGRKEQKVETLGLASQSANLATWQDSSSSVISRREAVSINPKVGDLYLDASVPQGAWYVFDEHGWRRFHTYDELKYCGRLAGSPEWKVNTD